MIFQKGLNGQTLNKGFTQADLDALEPCDLHSPRVGRSHGVLPPPEPGSEEFIRQFNEVVEMVDNVRNNKHSFDILYKYHPRDDFLEEGIPSALLNAGASTPLECANIVRMDNPVHLAHFIQDELMRNGVELKKSDTKHFPFINTILDFNLTVALYQKIEMEKTFDVKYFYMHPRPEEWAEEVDTFGIYPCPNHPEYIPGHSSAAGAVYKVTCASYDLDEEMHNMVYDCCYLFACFRAYSGMHYMPSCLAGLESTGMPTGLDGAFQHLQG